MFTIAQVNPKQASKPNINNIVINFEKSPTLLNTVFKLIKHLFNMVFCCS